LCGSHSSGQSLTSEPPFPLFRPGRLTRYLHSEAPQEPATHQPSGLSDVRSSRGEHKLVSNALHQRIGEVNLPGKRLIRRCYRIKFPAAQGSKAVKNSSAVHRIHLRDSGSGLSAQMQQVICAGSAAAHGLGINFVNFAPPSPPPIRIAGKKLLMSKMSE